MQDNATLPIGVFDSGMGGLTVLRELKKHLPEESFIYLGDMARLPYGTKSPETVKQYAIEMAKILIEQKIKCLVVACNTATTSALHTLQMQFPALPIIGVVEPGALAATQGHHQTIAILATETTIKSGTYQATIKKLAPKVNIITQPCGLFVALAEEGCINDQVAFVTTSKYLTPLVDSLTKTDCVLLGCTHFPVLIKPIRAVLGENITVVDSAASTAQSVKTQLTQLNLLSPSRINSPPVTRFLVTDSPERFARVGEIFLGEPCNPTTVELIDISSPKMVIDKLTF